MAQTSVLDLTSSFMFQGQYLFNKRTFFNKKSLYDKVKDVPLFFWSVRRNNQAISQWKLEEKYISRLSSALVMWFLNFLRPLRVCLYLRDLNMNAENSETGKFKLLMLSFCNYNFLFLLCTCN